MKNIQNLIIDINKKPFQSITANVGEVASRFVRINIVDKSIPMDLTGVTASLYAEKSDGKKVFNNVTIEDKKNGIILAELTSQILAIEGLVKLTLLLVKNNSKLCSKQFLLNVDSSIVDDEAIESTNEFTALVDALGRVNNIDSRFEEFSSQLTHNTNKIQNMKTINILDLGCKADGVFDNTGLIRKAINEYDVIYFPYTDNGTYLISGEIEINRKVVIYGDYSQPFIKQSLSNRDIFQVKCDGVVVRNLKLGGVVAPDSSIEAEKTCIRVDGYNDCVLENLRIDGSDDAGLRIGYKNLEDGTKKQSTNNVIRNCYITNVSEGSPIELINSIYTTVENCVIETNYNNRWGIRNVSSSHNIIKGCTFRNNRIAIAIIKGESEFISEDIFITDCIFDLSYNSHLKIQGEDVKINNCIFKNSNLQTLIALSIENGNYISNNISISNCEFRNFNINIKIQNLGNVYIDNCNFIEPKIVEGSGSGSISCIYIYTNNKECGNLFIKNCVSICSLNEVMYQYILFSGTPTNTEYFIRSLNNEWIAPGSIISTPQCRNNTYKVFTRFNNDTYNYKILNS